MAQLLILNWCSHLWMSPCIPLKVVATLPCCPIPAVIYNPENKVCLQVSNWASSIGLRHLLMSLNSRSHISRKIQFESYTRAQSSCVWGFELSKINILSSPVNSHKSRLTYVFNLILSCSKSPLIWLFNLFIVKVKQVALRSLLLWTCLSISASAYFKYLAF